MAVISSDLDMKIVCVSDSHQWYPENNFVPDGDVLVHAGDISSRGKLNEIARFSAWFSSLPHKHKIMIAGNHDFAFEHNKSLAQSFLHPSIVYLQDSGVEIEGVKFYGMPWQPEFCNWAFNLERSGKRLKYFCDQIPDKIDVLISHGPPHGILDVVERGEHVGCEFLRQRVMQVKPKLHVFGHIHCSYGQQEHDGIKFVNASMCDEDYEAVNRPIIIEV